MPTPCSACGRGFPQECKKKVRCKVEVVSDVLGLSKSSSGSKETEPKKLKKGGTYEDLKDPKSTGRKRAAKLYPIDRDNPGPCEWRGKKNCGGGRNPIVGCMEGVQQARHHGPVKNTTRNQIGNVHRICDRCHNHWHELNDLGYVESDNAMLPHDPMDATEEELALDEVAWITGQMGKRFTLASSTNKGKLKLVD